MPEPLIVYGSSISPFVRKVLVICAEKGIEVENQIFGPGMPPTPEFLEASPFGKIPALRDGDYTLADSTAIAVYLDACYPEPKLIPDDAEARGKVMWFDEMADTIVFASAVKIFFNRVVGPLTGRAFDLDAARRAEAEEMPAILDYLERTAPQAGWLMGEEFSLADIAVATPFVNLALAARPVSEEAHPRLCAYLQRVHARPSFKPLIESNHAFIDRVRDKLHLAA